VLTAESIKENLPVRQNEVGKKVLLQKSTPKTTRFQLKQCDFSSVIIKRFE
jgi:hypothetical protein